MRSLIALVLFAAAAQAQPIVGPEVLWRTTSGLPTFRPAAPAARIQPDRGGFIVSWSEGQGYAGRLDGDGRLIAVGIHSTGPADGVSVAPLGDRYIAAWQEPEAGDGRPMLVTAALDRDFKLLSARAIGLTAGTTVVRTTASRAYAASGKLLYELDADGAPVNVYDLPGSADDLAIAGDEPVTINHSFARIPCLCVGGSFDQFSLSVLWLFHLTTGWNVILPANDARGAVASRNDRFLAVWFENRVPPVVKGSFFGSQFQPFEISKLGPSAFDSMTQPQIASDGTRWVAVWPHGDGIQGAVIDDSAAVMPFTVGLGRRPAIASAEPGRFVVTYETYGGLASRVIEFR